MSFKIQIENFEGPIDALLQLIEKRKMTINDISLVEITDDYIKFVQGLENESLSNMTHFIFVASTLTLIKSKSLLPNLDLTDDEEGDIEDLKRRIALFKEFQDISLHIREFISQTKKFHYPRTRKREVSFTPHASLNKTQLLESLSSVLVQIPKKENKKKEASVRIAVHIDEMMKSLETRIRKSLKTNFSSFIQEQIGDRKEIKTIKVYKVIGFLAMLELVKNRALDVVQEESFELISIESVKTSETY